ncbi:MAG TPA: MG2 domain-containing protein, partial [Spirochaetota bacterium]|nr:MG2 domain-containing protein [Spirochaetota bacterium]
EIYEQKYNNLLSQYQYNKISSIKTEEEGTFEIKSNAKDYRTLYIEISKGEDKFEFIGANSGKNEDKFVSLYQPYTYVEQAIKKGKVFLFTDRAIYRPGQNIYFKAIALESDGKNNNKILENTNVNLILYDVNWQKAGELNLTTNKFGSVSGTFVAPKAGITGQMQIYANLSYYGQSGSTAFSVEEYKRPKFEVIFQPVKGSYRLNDVVKLTGNAKAYSGANIDNAKVKYRVTRTANFPYWFYYWYGYYPESAESEILNGELKTDENGDFSIEFKAIPDMSVPKESKPRFTYQISVDITDLNGETRSGTNYLSIGYNALNISINIWDNVDKDKKSEFDIYSTNFAGEYEDSEGIIKIYKLKNPDKFFRNRLWAKPDKFVYSLEESKKYFPDDLYEDENNFYKWQQEKEVYSQKYNTKQSKKLILNELKSYEDGKYYLEIATKDKYGVEVKEAYYFTLYSTQSKYTPIPAGYVFNEDKSRIEPGETLKLEIAALSNDAIFEIERDGTIIEKRALKLNSVLNKGLLQKQTIEIPIKEEYRGNIGLHYVFVNNGRLYSQSKTITVPFTNKELDITFETFRDKLMPGEEEEWKIKIAGKNKEKFASETVMSLYDASLEAFRSHDFYFNIYNSFYASLSWGSLRGFSTVGFSNYAPNWNKNLYETSVKYDDLNWF